MRVQPYLFLDGRCEEALEFYKKTLGAEVKALMRFKENPEAGMNPPNSGEKIMHCAFTIGETEIMASDGMCAGKPVNAQGLALTISLPKADDVTRVFTALSDGGQVQMPLSKTFFASNFGMVSDRFGVSWMVIADA